MADATKHPGPPANTRSTDHNSAKTSNSGPQTKSLEASGQRISSSGRHAVLVASGIFLSRIAGLIRDRAFAHYFGNSDAADAFRAAFRIPNFLQNLFGEGVLSASFIPVYARLLGEGDEKEARRVAGAVAGLLALVTSVLVLAGVLTTPWLIDAIAPGFHGAKRELTIHLVRILFPGAGLLVLSAWCLGILNSHRRFFVSYSAPVVWNAAILASLLFWGGRMGQWELAARVAWGAVAGSALQVLVQLPTVLKLMGRLQLQLGLHINNVRVVLRNFFPVFISRGVVQLSAYVDSLLASLLPTGAVAALAYTQTLYTLPVSLFGMAVSAAELPAMSGALGSEDQIAAALRARLNTGLRRIAHLVAPSAVAFLTLGDVIAGGIYQSGKFTHADSQYVWAVLAGASVGLLASTLGRLYSSAFYALRDTRTPLKFAILRVALTTLLGWFCAIMLPPLLGFAPRWGVAGLTASAGVAGWVEFVLLRAALNLRIGATGLPRIFLAEIWGASFVAAAFAWAAKLAVGPRNPLIVAVIVLGIYGIVYVGATLAMDVPETRGLAGWFARQKRG